MKNRTCIWCGERPPRPDQRTCQPCHNKYVRDQRVRKALAKVKAMEHVRGEYVRGQLSAGA